VQVIVVGNQEEVAHPKDVARPPERRRRSPPERINSPPERSRSRRHSRSSPSERSSPRRHSRRSRSRRSRSRRSRSLSRSDGIIYLLIKILLITLLINFYNRNKINSNNVELSDRRST